LGDLARPPGLILTQALAVSIAVIILAATAFRFHYDSPLVHRLVLLPGLAKPCLSRWRVTR
jgi:hypothetical protein